MNTVNTCLFALRFVLLSYVGAPKVEFTAPVQADLRITRAVEERLYVCQSTGERLPEEMLLEERLAVRGCLRGLAEAINRAAELEQDMRAYKLGIAPSHPDIQAAIAAVMAPAVAA